MIFKCDLIHHRLFQARLTSFVVFKKKCRLTVSVGLEQKNTVKMDPEG